MHGWRIPCPQTGNSLQLAQCHKEALSVRQQNVSKTLPVSQFGHCCQCLRSQCLFPIGSDCDCNWCSLPSEPSIVTSTIFKEYCLMNVSPSLLSTSWRINSHRKIIDCFVKLMNFHNFFLFIISVSSEFMQSFFQFHPFFSC